MDLVKAGLQNGGIKLQGSNVYESNNAEQIKRDCDYLNQLINSLAENLVEQSKKQPT
jgi:hypothetical protein